MAPRFINDYVSVNDRLLKFKEEHPDASIFTDVFDTASKATRVKATISLKTGEIFTGHSEYIQNENEDKLLEKAETVAVGRALAFAGYSSKKSLASEEELEDLKPQTFVSNPPVEKADYKKEEKKDLTAGTHKITAADIHKKLSALVTK